MALLRVSASSFSCIKTKLGFVGAVSNHHDQNLQLLFPPQPSQSHRQFYLGRRRPRAWDPCDFPYSIMARHTRSELKEFVEPAKFAVEQYNKLENADDLQFVRVVKAATQVVCGLMYHITLEAINSGGEKKRYETHVWSNAAKKGQLELSLFEPLNYNQANKYRGGRGSAGGCAR